MRLLLVVLWYVTVLVITLAMLNYIIHPACPAN